MTYDVDAPRFAYRRANGYGWDVYHDGVWVAWTAGTRDDARAVAAEIARVTPPGVCDKRGPGGECVRDHEPCPDFPIPSAVTGAAIQGGAA